MNETSYHVASEFESCEGTYPKNWRKYIRIMALGFCSLVSCIITALGVYAALKWHHTQIVDYLVLLLLLCYALGGIALYLDATWPCPKCAKRFSGSKVTLIGGFFWYVFWLLLVIPTIAFPEGFAWISFYGSRPYSNSSLDTCAHCNLHKYPKFPLGNDPKRFDSFL